jgi:hypothetical protein
MPRAHDLRTAAAGAAAHPLLAAIRDGDEEAVVATLDRFVRSHRRLAPFAVLLGGVAMLLAGVRLLFANWRLTVVQLLPAVWIWLAMYDLRAHVLHGDSFHDFEGPVLIPVAIVLAAITAASFFLNAVFAFAIAQPGRPVVRRAGAEAREHIVPIVVSGGLVGLGLGAALTFGARAGSPWFALALGIVIGVMMVAYVAVPARLIGVEQRRSRRDRLSATIVGGALGVMVSAPPYLLGRIGLLMIGSPVLFVPGIVLFAIGVTLQAGATGAVKAVKMGAKLTAPGAAGTVEAPAEPGRPRS